MKIALGTAQFGMDYGVSNLTGQTSMNIVKQILKTAQEYGIDCLDTAHAYGNAESVLGSTGAMKGNNWKIVTKTPVIDGQTVTEASIIESFLFH